MIFRITHFCARSEASILQNLRVRYFADRIYTYTGDILISLNPYRNIPGTFPMITP